MGLSINLSIRIAIEYIELSYNEKSSKYEKLSKYEK